MIHVQCPSCAADYDLDERRLPAAGTTMRCPGCSHRFHVSPDGSVAAAGASGVPPAGGASAEAAADDGDDIIDLDPDDLESIPPEPSLPAHADLPAPKKGSAEVDLPTPARPRGRGNADAGVDLPAPTGRHADLPAPRGGSVDVPAPRRGAALGHAGFGGDDDLDLPTPVRSPGAEGSDHRDLPVAAARAGRSAGGPQDSLDVPAGHVDLPARGTGHADLPAPRPIGKRSPGGSALDDLDLPMPKSGVDLPQAKQGRAGAGAHGTPAGGGALDDLDLPTPRRTPPTGGRGALDDLDLPMPKPGSVDLPRARGSSDLPRPGGRDTGAEPIPGGALDDGLDLPDPPSAPGGAAPAAPPDPPAPATGGFGDLDLSPPGPAAAGPGRGSQPPDSLDLPDFDMALPGPDRPVSSMPPQRASSPTPAGPTVDAKRGAGGVSFGEIDLGGGEVGDEMEFADLPEEGELDLGGPPGLPSLASVGPRPGTRAHGPVPPSEGDADSGRIKVPPVVVALGVLVGLACVVGVGLGWTRYGYFGRYFLEQFLPAAGTPAVAARAIDEAEALAETDTYEDVRKALAVLADERRNYGLNRRLLTRSLMHEHLFRVRFGQDAASQSRAAAIRARLEERGGQAYGMDLARAASALAEGRPEAAPPLLARAAREAPRDPYVALIQGEAALASGDAQAATEAFKTALELGGETRAGWGVARALLAAEDDGAEAAVRATLAKSPRHVAARVELAATLLRKGELDDALRLAREAVGELPVDDERLAPSPSERPAALSVLGRIHEARGNRVAALTAFEESLSLDPYAVDALLGAGRVLLLDGRGRDALGRFRAVLDRRDQVAQAPGADGRPAVVEAQLGAVDAMLRAGLRNEAKSALAPLLSERADDPLVHLWMGRVHQALEDWDDAERELRKAVELDPGGPAPRLALARLFFAQERDEKAEELLAEAQENMPDSVALHRELGSLFIERRELDRAVGAYERALELHGDDTAARFGLGVALRRDGRYDAASEAFDQVAATDPSWPGLALERGRVFEARGRADEAVASYRKALDRRPGDPDLLLRLGAAQTVAGELDAAKETLEAVLVERPRSGEAEHFLGRVAFANGDIPTALTHFERALGFDQNPAEFHLYHAWAALEADRLGQALASVEKAIERDDRLPRAFWIRGRVYLRSGAAADARRDFERSLELDPNMHEAHADLGDAYDQLRRLPEAIRSYERALDGDRSEGRWWYRLGRLNLDAGRRREAELSLEKATRLGEPADPTPEWLADAYRLYGDALRLGGSRQAAAEQYQRYLGMAPSSAFDRAEVQRWIERARGDGTLGDRP